MAYTKYSLTPANNNAAPPDGAPEGMLPSAVNDTMRDMMAQIRDVGDGIRGGTYTMTAPVITGGSITGVALSGNTFTNPVITGGSINNTPIGASTANTGAFTTLSASSATTFSGATVVSGSLTANTFSSSGATITGGSINGTTIGGSTAAAGTFTSLSDSGNLTFTGTGNRITGDFSNATVANRVAFQSSTTNGITAVSALPNGTATDARFSVFNNSDPTNANGIQILANATEARLQATNFGTAPAFPLTMYTGGSERLRIDTSGNVGIGVTPSPWSDFKALQISSIGVLAAHDFGSANTQLRLISNAYWDGANFRYITSNPAAMYVINGREHIWSSVASGTAGNSISFTESMRIDSSGNVGIGISSPASKLTVNGSLDWNGNTFITSNDRGIFFDSIGSYGWGIGRTSSPSGLQFLAGGTERMRINSDGNVLVGTTVYNDNTKGILLSANGRLYAIAISAPPLTINRLTSDGDLVEFKQADALEGTISVSGTTVSYNGGHLARWSQLPNNQKDDTLLKGTVMSNLDDMCVWVKDGETLPNEQLNKMKVSDVEGDTNVAGVFVNWTRDEDCNSDDMNVAMTGDMIIRIAQGVVVQKGDLLMSAGDGTAKPQGDDIVRSKTVAKVTSNHVTCTYQDGSYCVPCVLMAC